MARLQIRDVKEGLDALREECNQTNSEFVQANNKLVQANGELAQKLDQVKVAVYVLATVQLGLVAHLLFSILSR